MARGRVITPEFWTDGNMIGLSPFARLFYIGLWNFAYCDKGHLPDDAMGLKLKVLPADPVDPDALIRELMGRGRVVRVEAEGKTFLAMPTFEGHQKSDPRWKTRCPACGVQDSLKLAETPESLGEHTETHQTSALREEERKGIDKSIVQGKPAHDYDSEFSEWWVIYPRKQAKAPALKAFRRIRKTVPLETLMTGVQAYALANLGQDKSLIKLPAGWLNDERWADDLSAPALSRSVTKQPDECRLHVGYPLPCDRCARDREEGNPF